MAKKLGDWTQLSSKVVYKNKWIQIIEDKVLTPTGEKSLYGFLDVPQSVVVIALNEARQFPIILRSRYPRGGQLEWSLPGGSVDKGEDPLTAAQRELSEEVSMNAENWHALGKTVPYSGGCSETQFNYIAESASSTGPLELTDDHIIEMKLITAKEAFKLVASGDLFDGQTIAALALAQAQGRI